MSSLVIFDRSGVVARWNKDAPYTVVGHGRPSNHATESAALANARRRADAWEYLQAAADGFSGIDHDCARHGMLTSARHACFVVGQHLRAVGFDRPFDCRPGRGDLVHCSGMLWRINWAHVRHPSVVRVS